MTTATTRLTDLDRYDMARARELADLSADAVEQCGPHYVVGQAQDVIKQLLATIDRLGGDSPPPVDFSDLPGHECSDACAEVGG